MKKAAFLVASVAIFAVVSVALAGQYARPKAYAEPSDTGMTAYAEKTTSMTDCMTFSASHKSRGEAADKVKPCGRARRGACFHASVRAHHEGPRHDRDPAGRLPPLRCGEPRTRRAPRGRPRLRRMPQGAV